MLKKILLGIAALILVVVVVAMLQAPTYYVERSATIHAPAEVVWAEISDFGQWKAWSHWDEEDPSQKTTISGEPGVVGHRSEWVGDKTGKGVMTITEVERPTSLITKLEFFEPMAGVGFAAFKLAEKGETVEITWDMAGEKGFIGKVMGLFMNMDTMIGTAYEKSLANLKTIAEENAANAVETNAAEEAAPTAENPAENPAEAAEEM